jgi:hypothetical protein
MTQLSFFDMVGAKVLDAAQHEKNVQESKRKAAKATNEKRKAAAEAPVVEEQLKELAPTWEVHFFDKDLAQRIAWYRAKDEEIAKVKCKKDYGTTAKIFFTQLSKRTLEEIEALD